MKNQTIIIQKDKPILFVMPSGARIEIEFKDFASLLLQHIVLSNRSKPSPKKLRKFDPK